MAAKGLPAAEVPRLGLGLTLKLALLHCLYEGEVLGQRKPLGSQQGFKGVRGLRARAGAGVGRGAQDICAVGGECVAHGQAVPSR